MLMLPRDLGVFPKHAPPSCVPYETQSEATVLAFNFLYCSVASLPNTMIPLKIREASDP